MAPNNNNNKFLLHLYLAVAVQPHMASDVIAIKEGADLDLSCPIVVPSEDMIISWTCDNEPASIKSSRIHVTESGKLRIRSAKVGDSCNYRCEAADGFNTLSVLIKVIIVDKHLMERLNQRRNHHQHQQMPEQQQQLQYKSRVQKAAGSAAESGDSSSANAINNEIDQQQQRAANPIDATRVTVAAGGGQSPAADIQVEVSPTWVNVQRNKTFSLECQVRYGQLMREPQIVWLKEFIGRRPESLSEAHDQNLILIDDVYYHSLNWPRSLSYSKEAACANSALLIRQAQQVHSGRYICFAGYQPSFMLNSASLNHTSQQPNQALQKSQLRYKMAMATVRVGEVNGPETDERLGGGGSSGGLAQPAQTNKWARENLLISIFSADSWIRNLTLLIILSIGLLLLLKLVYARYKSSQTTAATATSTSKSGPLPSPPQPRQEAITTVINSGPADSLPKMSAPAKQQQQPLPLEDVSLADQAERQQQQHLHYNHSECEEDHVYSEIGERAGSISGPQESPSGRENIYKIPNKKTGMKD